MDLLELARGLRLYANAGLRASEVLKELSNVARKARLEPSGYNFSQKEVGKAFGRALIADAAILEIVVNNCKAVEKANGTRALNGTELHHLGVAIGELENAAKRLRAVGRNARRRSSG